MTIVGNGRGPVVVVPAGVSVVLTDLVVTGGGSWAAPGTGGGIVQLALAENLLLRLIEKERTCPVLTIRDCGGGHT